MTTKRVKFGDVVLNLNETVRSGVEHSLTRVVGLEHIDSGDPELRRWDELSSLPDGTSFTRVFRKGQVLFGKRRAYQRKVAVASFDGICSSDILVFASRSRELHPDFLLYVVQSDGFFAHALQTSSGSLSPRTRWQDLATFEFELPTIEEQHRIVEMMTAVDEHIESLRHQLDVLQTTRKSVLHHLLNAGGEGWNEATLGEIASWSSGKNLGSDKRINTGLIPILGANGVIGRTNEVLMDEELITVGRVGACGETHRSSGPVWVSDNALIVIPTEKVLFDLLFYILFTFNYQSVISGTTQQLITQGKMKSQIVNLPPLDEQQRIVDEVSKVDTLIQETNCALAATQELRSALLTKEIS